MIQNNIAQYDTDQIKALLIKLKEDLNLCVKIDENILNFFKNFRRIPDLKTFSTSILNHEVKKARRADIEED